MEIATQHSEAVGERARISVKEGLLFDGIALDSADIAPGHVERATLVEANFADTILAIRNGAAMPAGEAAHAIAIEFLVEFAFADVFPDDLAEVGHRGLEIHSSSSALKSRRGARYPFSE
jgi:hypothetical protein